MRRYNYLQALFMSFYSQNLYRDVKENWGGHVFAYLFLLILICWIPLVFMMQKTFDEVWPHMTAMVFNQMPETKIVNGMVKTPENRPYFFIDPDNKKTFGTIDTSGKYKTLDKTTGNFLVTKNKLIYSNRPDEIKIYDLSPQLNVVIHPQTLQAQILKIVSWSWVVLLPFLCLVSFFFRILQGFFYSIFGKLFSVLNKSEVPFTKIFILSLVSITPVIILQTVLDLLNINFSFHVVVTTILGLFYLFFAIHANKKGY